MMRSHYCGQLNETLEGQEITLCGWVHRRRDHGGVIFLDIRDRDGLAQVVFDPDRAESFAAADRVRSEYVVQITGKVRLGVPDGYAAKLMSDFLPVFVASNPKLELEAVACSSAELIDLFARQRLDLAVAVSREHWQQGEDRESVV